MTGRDVVENILYAREKYIKKNFKYPEFLIISNNLYFSFYKYMDDIAPLLFVQPDLPADLLTDLTIAGMKVKVISDSNILMVGCNEILKLKGENDVKD